MNAAFFLSWLLIFSGMYLAVAQENETEEVHAEHQSLKATVIVCILVVILFMTLIFEMIHETVFHILKHNDMEYLTTVVHTLFKEMTILGFISFVIFSLTRFGFIMQLNDKYIGQDIVEQTAIKELKAEHENFYAAPTTLFHLFEEVHIFVFFVMIIYALIVGIFFYLAAKKANQWQNYDNTSFIELLKMVDENRVSGDHLEYFALCSKFEATDKTFPSLPEGKISYSAYFSDCLTKFLVQIIEIPFSTWFCVILLVLFVRPVMDFPPVFSIIFLNVFTGGIFLYTLIFYVNAQHHKSAVLPNHDAIKFYLSSISKQEQKMPLPALPIDATPVLQPNKNFWCWIPGERRFVNRDEATFFITIKGPAYIKRVLQLLLFLNTLVITVIIMLLSSEANRRIVFHRFGAFFGLMPLVFVIASLFLHHQIALELTLLISTGYFFDKEVFLRQHEDFVQRQNRRNKQIVEFLGAKALKLFIQKSSDEYMEQMRFANKIYVNLSRKHKSEWQRIFGMFGEVSEEEIREGKIKPFMVKDKLDELIRLFNIGSCETGISNLEELYKMATAKDEGRIYFDSFLFIMMTMLERRSFLTKDMALKRHVHLVEGLCNMYDSDSDGVLLKSEFLDMLEGLDPSIGDKEYEVIYKSIMEELPFGQQLPIKQIIKWVTDMAKREKYYTPDDVLQPLSNESRKRSFFSNSIF